jgi:hypothetical protein
MKNQIVYITVALGTLLLNTPSVCAQSLSTSTSDGNFQSNEYDTTSGGSFGNSFNPLDLIHRANMSNGRDSQEFGQDSAENINNAAAEFKKLQLERLKNQQSGSSNSPVEQSPEFQQ